MLWNHYKDVHFGIFVQAVGDHQTILNIVPA